MSLRAHSSRTAVRTAENLHVRWQVLSLLAGSFAFLAWYLVAL
jgi:hypothetical protein